MLLRARLPNFVSDDFPPGLGPSGNPLLVPRWLSLCGLRMKQVGRLEVALEHVPHVRQNSAEWYRGCSSRIKVEQSLLVALGPITWRTYSSTQHWKNSTASKMLLSKGSSTSAGEHFRSNFAIKRTWVRTARPAVSAVGTQVYRHGHNNCTRRVSWKFAVRTSRQTATGSCERWHFQEAT